MRADKAKLRLAMARACISSAELTEAANMPRPTVNKVISGQSVNPKTIGCIAKALNVDVTDILATNE